MKGQRPLNLHAYTVVNLRLRYQFKVKKSKVKVTRHHKAQATKCILTHDWIVMLSLYMVVCCIHEVPHIENLHNLKVEDQGGVVSISFTQQLQSS